MSLAVATRTAPVQAEHTALRESHTSDPAKDEFAGMLAGAMQPAPAPRPRAPQPEGTSELDRPDTADDPKKTAEASAGDGDSNTVKGRRHDDRSDDDPKTAAHRHDDNGPHPAGAANAVVQSTAVLDPELQAKLARVIARVRQDTGSDVKVVETYRSQSRQEALYAQGRETPGPVVTWTRHSKHTQGRAVDLLLDGGLAGPDAYQVLQRIAQEEGLRTLGAMDPGHLELPGPARDAGAPASGLAVKLGIPMNEDKSGANAARLTAAIDPANLTQSRAPAAAGRAAAPLAPVAQVASVAQVATVAQPAPVARVATVAQVATIAVPGAAQPVAAPAGSEVHLDARLASKSPAASNTAPAAALNGPAAAAQVRAADPDAATPGPGGPLENTDSAESGVSVRPTVSASQGAQPNAAREAARAQSSGASSITTNHASASRSDNAPKNAPGSVSSSASTSAASSATPRFGGADTGGRSREHGTGGHDAHGYSALAAAVAMRAGDSSYAAVREAAAAGAPGAAERAARVIAALEDRPAAPLSRLTMSVDAGNGLTDRIEVALRGASIDTTIDAGDLRGADAMRARADELVRALSKDGLTVDSLRVRAAASSVGVAGPQQSGGSSDSLGHSRSERSAPWQQHRQGSGDDRREQQRQRRGGQER